jgi:hypothetical protein
MNHPDIFTFGTNQADFGGTYLFIDARASVSLRRRVVGSASYGFIPLMIAEFRGGNLDGCAQCFKQHKGLKTGNSHD